MDVSGHDDQKLSEHVSSNLQGQTDYSNEFSAESSEMNLKAVQRTMHACALELHTVFGFSGTPGVQPQVNFKYHEEIGVFCKRAPPGFEPAISRMPGGCSTITLARKT